VLSGVVGGGDDSDHRRSSGGDDELAVDNEVVGRHLDREQSAGSGQGRRGRRC
jgi:hypothetical protein